MKNNTTYDMHLQTHNRMAQTYGMGAKALWNSQASQQVRFRIMAELFQEKEKISILDLGCGLGHFYEYIKENDLPVTQYTGVDINPAFVQEMLKKWPDINLIEGDAHDFAALKTEVDYVVASGLFNIGESREAVNEIFLDQFKTLMPYVRKGIAVNFLSLWSGNPDERSIYRNPESMLRLCKENLGSYVRLIHDYLPHDFTIFIRKEKL